MTAKKKKKKLLQLLKVTNVLSQTFSNKEYPFEIQELILSSGQITILLPVIDSLDTLKCCLK